MEPVITAFLGDLVDDRAQAVRTTNSSTAVAPATWRTDLVVTGSGAVHVLGMKASGSPSMFRFTIDGLPSTVIGDSSTVGEWPVNLGTLDINGTMICLDNVRFNSSLKVESQYTGGNLTHTTQITYSLDI